MKDIEPSQANNKVLADMVAGRISAEMKKRNPSAQEIIDSTDTKIKINLW